MKRTTNGIRTWIGHQRKRAAWINAIASLGIVTSSLGLTPQMFAEPNRASRQLSDAPPAVTVAPASHEVVKEIATPDSPIPDATYFDRSQDELIRSLGDTAVGDSVDNDRHASADRCC